MVISRQAAIDALRMDISIIPFAKAREYVREAIETIYNRLEKLPSAQQERKKGTWIVDNDIPCICSECGTNWIDDYVDSRELYITGKIPNYCPNCGSYNRSEKE